MHADLADTVHPILDYALSLRYRLDAGEPLQWDLEQSTLKAMLSPLTAEANAEADVVEDFSFDFSEKVDHLESLRQTQKTVHIALTYWLDEFFIRHTSWSSRWSERTLESAFFGTNEGSRKFWEEARYAEARGDRDALESLLWCVMLGFRGDEHASPNQVEAWGTRIRARLEPSPAWTMPASLQTSRGVLRAGDLPYRRRAFAMLLTLSLFVPLALVMLWRHWPA
jgi:type VI protein secretion system component VasF